MGLIVLVILGRPHLVLAHVGDDQCLAIGVAPQVVDHVRGVQVPVVGQVLDVAHGAVALHLVDVRQPFAVIAGFEVRQRSAQAISRRSPTSARSTLTFLLISDGSISMWIFFALGA